MNFTMISSKAYTLARIKDKENMKCVIIIISCYKDLTICIKIIERKSNLVIFRQVETNKTKTLKACVYLICKVKSVVCII